MFTLKNVSKTFGDEYALRDISMTIGQGLNFIIGASGSGKTTLLKILSGMEQDFQGEATYRGDPLNALTRAEKSYYYHHVFGFVWQDFNLLDDCTVLENVMLPQYLGGATDKKAAMKLLREVKLEHLAGQRAGKLSGGQKQRVALARELMKNPQVLLADEPTSALDEASAQGILALLRKIAKTRTVIIVTHDTSLIDGTAQVYELDKGELAAAAPAAPTPGKGNLPRRPHGLSPQNACRLAGQNLRRKWGHFATSALSLLVASVLLLVTVSGAITGSSSAAFDELLATYGQGILDLNVVGSFTSAGGTGGSAPDAPSADVTQNIDGLYESYCDDARVTHILLSQAFDNIKITADGKPYEIKSTGSAPTVNDLTAGVMPMGSGNEVVVPNSFARLLGLTDREMLGKSISFSATIYNWDTGKPVAVPVQTVAEIVGVIDTTVKYDYGGEQMEYTVDDAFFFSKAPLEDMRAQAKVAQAAPNFTIRAKTPAHLISLKDELNAQGIVPLGRFELVEDMVRLSGQTSRQSSAAVVVIAALSLVVVLAVALMTALSRRREYAIYKVSGYANRHLALLVAAETLLTAAGTVVLLLALSPLLQLATMALWGVQLLHCKLLLTGALLVLGTGALSGAVTALVAANTKASQALTTGEK